MGLGKCGDNCSKLAIHSASFLSALWKGDHPLQELRSNTGELFLSEILSSDDASSVAGRYTGCRMAEEVQRTRRPVEAVSAHVSLLARPTLFREFMTKLGRKMR